MPEPLMSLKEAAEYLGIERESARRLLARHGITHGYPESEVHALERTQGRRTDLQKGEER
jgi:predicted HTH domain antitoxin